MLITRKILAAIWVISFVLVIGSSFGLIDPFSLLFWVAITAMGLITIHTNIYQREWYRRLRSVACRWLIVELSKRLKHEDQLLICLHVLMASVHIYKLEEQLVITTSNEIMNLRIVSAMKTKGIFKNKMNNLIHDKNLKQAYLKLHKICMSEKPIHNN